jgi:hypothetical protein
MTAPHATTASTADLEAVSAVATEYFQSWFSGDGERMRACLHPALAKRTAEQPGTDSLVFHEDPTEQLVRDTASGEGTEFQPEQEVTVLDVFRDMATVMVRSEPFVEYLHLARFGNRWLIVNALYTVLV